uniref:Uncharacterized protein n=1 Tax=Lepeophtheirus salmonis TaxID=72036 RepID=A0A0K2T330_LEPSM
MLRSMLVTSDLVNHYPIDKFIQIYRIFLHERTYYILILHINSYLELESSTNEIIPE